MPTPRCGRTAGAVPGRADTDLRSRTGQPVPGCEARSAIPILDYRGGALPIHRQVRSDMTQAATTRSARRFGQANQRELPGAGRGGVAAKSLNGRTTAQGTGDPRAGISTAWLTGRGASQFGVLPRATPQPGRQLMFTVLMGGRGRRMLVCWIPRGGRVPAPSLLRSAAPPNRRHIYSSPCHGAAWHSPLVSRVEPGVCPEHPRRGARLVRRLAARRAGRGEPPWVAMRWVSRAAADLKGGALRVSLPGPGPRPV